MKKPQNYYFEVISPEKAKALFREGKTEIYKMFSDDTEALIESEHDLDDAIDLSIELATENPIT
ncbi:MAG: hypothetical protein H7Y10_03455 [Flavobacterium sp.]|nr:hypothetical protein [Flavobacterium sp.]